MLPAIGIALLITGVTGAGLVYAHSKGTQVPPGPDKDGPDKGGGGGLPGTLPATDLASLLQKAQGILTNALLNPAGADVSQIGVLAATLRANGHEAEAAQLEAAGTAACLAQGKPGTCWQIPILNGNPPVTGTGLPAPGLPTNLPALVKAPQGSSQAGYQATIAQARDNPGTVPLDRLQRFAREARLSTPPLLAEAAWLDALAAQRTGMANTASQTEVLARYTNLRANPPKDPRLLDQLVADLGAQGFPAQAMEIAALAQRLRALGAAGVPVDAPINPNASTLPPALVAQMNDLLNNPAADPVKVDTLIATIQMNYPGGFLTQLAQLQARAKQLREVGR